MLAYQKQGLDDDDAGQPAIWKLKRALYGLRRSPKLFYTQLREYLLLQGYTNSPLDNCLFHKITATGKIFFCTHVDDFAIAASSPELIEELCSKLKEKYIITESDSLESFLGVHMERHDGCLYLSQPGLIAKLVTAAGIEKDTHVYHNPMREDFSDEYQDDSPACSQDIFRSLLGMLIYMLRSRPDIAFSVNRLATRSTNATERDLEAIKRVVSYLRSTSHLELVYRTQNPDQVQAIAELHAWCDAAYACHRDSKSHSGMCFSYGTAPTGAFFSQSRKQTTVATSSTEAEVNAAFEASKYVTYFRDLLSELGYPQVRPTKIWVA
jgi:hypothetical protein